MSTTGNYMSMGIMNALDQKVEKFSPTLGRQAIYSQRSRLTRLPRYLAVHMMRFAWRSDINKKAKILRRVKFPLEFDALQLATDELKQKIQPLNTRLKEIRRERANRDRVRNSDDSDSSACWAPDATDPDRFHADLSRAPTNSQISNVLGGLISHAMRSESGTASLMLSVDPSIMLRSSGPLEKESVYREREDQELKALVDPDIKADVGCSVSGLYDLIAIVTHKGVAADAGHYIGFVKKSVFHASLNEDDESWYKFDDDRVSVFSKEKLATLDGGGEDSSAYMLLYKSKEE